MKITLSDAGKRFNRDWIFRHFSWQFKKGNAYAITGPNGSGKSTLLQVLSGGMLMNEGSLVYEAEGREPGVRSSRSDARHAEVTAEEIFKHVSICAPYLEVVEEMTLNEFFDFHRGFKPFLPGMSTENIIAILELEKAANKQIRYYSSGMKQRVKLAQCIFSDTAIVLLDEPCTNLDSAGIELYNRLIAEYCMDRLVIVSSNDEVEYRFINQKINILEYK